MVSSRFTKGLRILVALTALVASAQPSITSALPTIGKNEVQNNRISNVAAALEVVPLQADIDPNSCLTSTWSPGAKTFLVPKSATSTQLLFTVTSQNAIDANTAQYGLYVPGPNASWSAWQSAGLVAQQITTNSVVISANIGVYAPSSGALQAIQFRLTPTSVAGNVCSSIYNILPTDRKFYLPSIFSKYDLTQQDITTTSEPNNTVCDAYIALSGVTYTAFMEDTNDFYKISVPVTGTVLVTVTGYTGSGQVQLRRSTGLCDAGVLYRDNSNFLTLGALTRTLVVTGVTPGDAYIRVVAANAPNVSYKFTYSLDTSSTSPPATGFYEPNNSACEAKPIGLNTNIQAYAEDVSDWYSFTLTTTSSLTISLNNMNTDAWQYILYKSEDCNALGTNLGVIGKPTTTNDYGSRAAGKYFLRVAASGNLNATQLYTLRIGNVIQTAGWGPEGDICPAMTNCSPNRTAGNVTVYWGGISGATALRIWFEGRQTGNCQKGGSTNSVNPTITSSGSVNFTGIQTGYYAVHIDADRAGYTSFRREVPLKMDCEFLATNATIDLTELFPELQPTIIPEEPVAVPLE